MRRVDNKKLEKLKKAKVRKKKIKLVTLLMIMIFAFVVYMPKSKIIKGKETVPNQVAQKEKDPTEVKNNTINTVSPEENLVANNTSTETKNTDNGKAKQVEQIVEKYMNENNLNETNFAFFYYNPKTETEYLYNEDHYFLAASTIKVPLAMLYYDKINNGDLTLKSTFQYEQEEFEPGNGETAVKYDVGDKISLSYLLDQMIVNSDNTATNILKVNLGSEDAYRMLIKQYTLQTLPAEFNTENITSASYSLDVLKRIYNNQDDYNSLIALMKKSSGNGYLKKYVDYAVAHKYGSYDENVHDYGIVYSDDEYLIGVFTSGVSGAEELIAKINLEIASL